MLTGARNAATISATYSAGENTRAPKAVIFDLGGVVVASPEPIFHGFERQQGLDRGSLVDTILSTGESGCFARMERGEITVQEFAAPFAEEYAAHTGRRVAQEEMAVFASALSDIAKLQPREEVTECFAELKRRGLKVCILTNNFLHSDGSTVFPSAPISNVDVVVQSCLERLKKPDPAIYDLALKRLGVWPEEAVFLDDLGPNLKSAKEMGMATIKVDEDISEALSLLRAMLEQGVDGE